MTDSLTVWENCYEHRWTGFITAESFSHPAKFSRGLIERIYDHMLAKGWIKKGDVVSDCFGGIATGGLIAAYRGLNWIGVELEPRFVALAKANIELHRSKLERLGCPIPEIIQGDSRKFYELIKESAAVLTSLPYVDARQDTTRQKSPPGKTGPVIDRHHIGSNDYGYGQIQTCKTGTVDAAITSPPFEDHKIGTKGSLKEMKTAWQRDAKNFGKPGHRATQMENYECPSMNDEYGNASGQIGKLSGGSVDATVTSPPYADGLGHGGKSPVCEKLATEKQHPYHVGGAYGETDGQIERLNVGEIDAVTTSPPYANIAAGAGGLNTKPAKKPGQQSDRTATLASQNSDHRYGKTDGQLSQKAPEDYWSAMLLVYRSCFLALKPGGYLAIVLKDYVKDKKRVPLCDDSLRLLEHIGFVLVERVHAMLTKEIRHTDLFDDETVKTKSRKSFFRRLAEKNGSPKIDFEEVLFLQKPGLQLA